MNWLACIVQLGRLRRGPLVGSSPLSGWLALWAIVTLTLTVASPCHAAQSNLLQSKTPLRAVGVHEAERLTDGVQARHGGAWDSDLTVRLNGTRAEVVYDLGSVTPINAAYLQGDNNDEYVISGSLDGSEYRVLWVASPVSLPGLQPRMSDSIGGSARFVKISAQGGDGRFSLSEVQLFAERPSRFPPDVRQRSGVPSPELVRSKMLLVTLALLFWVFATRRGMPRLWLWLTALAPAAAGYLLYDQMSLAWPVSGREVSLARALAAGLAGLVLLRQVVAPKQLPAHRVSSTITLSIAAVAAFMSFYNLGYPQFRDQAANEPLFVHNFDMRVYYPVAKYFPELRFDGLYQASVAAYVDDAPGVSLDSLENVELRDLKNHQMTRVRDVKAEIGAIRSRFTPGRWEAFKADMRYFRETMGVRDYLGSMVDHGGNATPVWLAIAHLIFAETTASNATLWWAGMLDPLLILAALAFIARTFGLRTMLVSAVVFGANDFYMFGSNWGGATLRHDWMAYLAVGICALKARRPAAGGALLALSALIRAFPALALAALALPVGWWVVERYGETKKLPTLGDLLREHRDFATAMAGAASCVAAFFLFSSTLFGFGAWPEWFAKVRLLDSTPHTNHVSLRALVAGSTHLQAALMEERAILFAVLAMLIGGAAVVLGRRKPLDQAALLGTLMIPIAFNPANYYIHFIFVLPMLARERSCTEHTPFSFLDVIALWSLLGVCVAQYWTTLVKDVDLHFQMATVIFFAGLTGLFATLLRREWLTAGLPILGRGELAVEDELCVDGVDFNHASENDSSERDSADDPADDDDSADDDDDDGDPADEASEAAEGNEEPIAALEPEKTPSGAKD